MKPNTISQEIIPLTSFRFITAFIVFLFHARIHLNWNTGVKYIDSFVWNGAIFMSAFFILSGFILYYTYRSVNFNSNLSALKNYYIKRFARIYPVYFVVLLLSSYLLLTLDTAQAIVIIVMNIFLIESFFYSSFPHWINGGVWSLSVEAFFYLMFPFLKITFDFLTHHKKKLFILSYFLAVFPSIVKMTFGGTADIYVNPFFRLGEFCLGMLVGMIYLDNIKTKKRHYSYVLGLSTIFIFLIVIALNRYIDDWFFTGFNFAILPFLCLAIYITALLSEKENRILFRLFSHPVFRYLGQISYSFYMIQFFVIEIFGKKILSDTFANIHILVFVLFFINILFAIILYEVFEKRTRHKIVKKYCIKQEQ